MGRPPQLPTIDVYLYDIREDMRRRDRGMINEYDADERQVVARHLPPRYFKLSYLVTAWTQRPEDEHRLLSTLLTTFLRFDALPEDLVTGSLAELGLAVPVTVALPRRRTEPSPTSGPRWAGSSSRPSTWWSAHRWTPASVTRPDRR